MLKESIAARYSAALFGLAKERGEVPQTVAELDAFGEALRKNPGLTEFYASPVIDRTVKENILRSALTSRASALVLNFLRLLVRKRRENLVEIVARQLHELLDRDAGRQDAAIATPRPLQSDALAGLAQRLSKLYGRTIVPKTRLSPELLGGVVVQVGDRYIDASVSGKLEELRRHLLATTESWRGVSPNGVPKH